MPDEILTRAVGDIDKLESQGHRHGKVLDVHTYQIRDHAEELKRRVTMDRYIWVERVVMGGCGALLYWVVQQILTK